MNPPAPAKPSAPAESAERQVTVQESGKPAQKCWVMKTWKTVEGASAYQVQAIDTGEIMTIVENGPLTTVPGSREGTRKQAMATRIFHWSRDKTPPAGTPMPPAETTPAVTRVPESPQPTLLPSSLNPTPMGSAAVTKKSVEPPQSTDWRQSWGKADDHSSTKVAEMPLPPPSPPSPRTKMPDPLQIPDQYSRVVIPEKPNTSKVDAERLTAQSATPEPIVMPPPTGEMSVGSHMVEEAISVNNDQGEPRRAGINPPAMPLGTRSVMAAYDGDSDAVRYIPVPIVTVPDVQRPPTPPMPPLPQPAQGRDSAGNAFGSNPSAMSPPRMPPPTGRTVNAFTPAVPAEAMAQSGNAFGRGNLMSTGVGNAGSSMMLPSPPTPGMSLADAAARDVIPQTTEQAMSVLRDALYPSQRELAAESLAKVDWHSHPHVVQALLTAARQDPAATVRAGCIRCLAQMNVNTVPVVEAARALRMDVDPRVRTEAEQAMIVLAPGSTFAKPAVLPASTSRGP
jgi:hypothetical protein